MKGSLLLAWRYLTFHRGQSAILVLCIALVALLPIAVELLVTHYSNQLAERARRTPLVVGAPGSRFDLLLSSLYFRGRVADPLPFGEVERIHDGGLAIAVPIYVQHTAQGAPLVGTTLDYFECRGLSLAAGHWPGWTGEAVLGSAIAEQLQVGPGGHLRTDTEKLFDISASYPLRLRVTGVLESRGTADDHAVFVDVKSAWVAAGIGHGHQDLGAASDDLILSQDQGSITANAAVVEYTEITADNIAQFHFHGDPREFPVTAILCFPHDDRSRTFLKSRLRSQAGVQPMVPHETYQEMMSIVFRVKRLFDANLVLVTTAMGLLLGLVILLTLRLRRREIETIALIGGSRGTVLRMLATELAIVVGTGLALAAAAAAGLAGLLLRANVV